MKTKIFILALFLSQMAYSQTIKKSSIDIGGASVRNASIQMVYTIGEVNVEEVTVGTIGISEGFIGPNIFSAPDNQTPVINEIVAPVDPIPLSENAIVEVFFTDNNLTEATISWGDGSAVVFGDFSSQPITWEYIYPAPGVYPISIKLVDVGGEIAEEIYRYIVVYDPEGGFVTGGGWINSPAGAYVPDPLLEGKANFGFVSKYKKGASIPTGNTEFQFKAGDLNFNSYVYDWLVIAGAKAKFKGEGTINGAGVYGFMISAIDGDLKDQGEDMFRIKIWDKMDGDVVVYDNQIEASDDADPTTELGGGSIVIHTTKDKLKSASVLDPEAKLKIYPNPFDNSIYVDLFSESTHDIIIDMVDMSGRVIEYMYAGIVKGKVDHHFELNTKSDLIPGYYMLRIRNVDGEYLGRKMILKQ